MLIKKVLEKGLTIGSKIAETFMDKGDIKYFVLAALEKESMHGYQIMQNIREEFLGLYIPSPGTIYPTLQMLEEQKLIKVKSKGTRKTYEITPKGREFLKENEKKIMEITKKVKESEVIPQIKKIAVELRDMGKETMNLAIESTKQNKELVKKKVQKTSTVLNETIKKIRKIWK